MKVNGPGRLNLAFVRKKFLAVGEACVAINYSDLLQALNINGEHKFYICGFSMEGT